MKSSKIKKVIFAGVLLFSVSVSSNFVFATTGITEDANVKIAERLNNNNWQTTVSENDKQQLLNDYNEKMTKNQNNTTIEPSTLNEEVNEAKERFLQRMNYIVDVINSYGENTTKDNTEFNLNFIKAHYDDIITLDNIDKKLIDWYVEEATFAIETKNMPDERVNNISTFATYNSANTVNQVLIVHHIITDALSLLDSNGLAYHKFIIVGYPGNNDFTFAAHTDNTNSRSLKSVVNSNGYIIYNRR